jgi:group I intron endonuclease
MVLIIDVCNNTNYFGYSNKRVHQRLNFGIKENLGGFLLLKTLNKKNMNDNNVNSMCLSNVSWNTLNKNGLMENTLKLKNQAAIYVYQFIKDKNKIYIGSTLNLSQRFRQHRYRISKDSVSCPKFYNLVKKHGWNNFKFGVLEYLDIKSKSDKKVLILSKEQYYLDVLSPSLNINKKAGSMLGFKHKDIDRLNFSLMRRGKTFKQDPSLEKIFKSVSLETRNFLKTRCRGTPVLVLDKDNKIINKFSTIKATAYNYNLSPSSISKYLKSGSLWFNYCRFIFSTDNHEKLIPKNQISSKECGLKEDKKGHILKVLDINYKSLFKFNSFRAASRSLGISRESLKNYSISKNLWNNKYYFNNYKV